MVRRAILTTRPETRKAHRPAGRGSNCAARRTSMGEVDPAGGPHKCSPCRSPLQAGPHSGTVYTARWFQQGLSQAEMARRIGLGTTTVNRICQRLGLQRRPTTPPEFPFDPSPTHLPTPESPSADPCQANRHTAPDLAPASLPVQGLPEPPLTPMPETTIHPEPAGPQSTSDSISVPAEKVGSVENPWSWCGGGHGSTLRRVY